ncbi:hypothetical protein M0D44_16510 [Xanthomonas prunicola]|uniref:hypothetical protein n=1 Tax=Xanthomonas prunicola TaxID=2053930 RepID=UPI0021B3F925|nr:hypothetical protein [Xanthomonas prunicola]UXA47914.1 hypothetical protein M0D44_16510 [Xanthomonas prunicola]
MSRNVTFKTLYLLSQRDKRARKLDLEPKTLLLGTNGKGKSRITKNLFWALGCLPPKKDRGDWDPNAIVALVFAYGGQEYVALRHGKRLGLFSDGALRFHTERIGSWDLHMSQIFGYHLNLTRHGGGSGQASIEHLLVPFYLDQDGGWALKWATFDGLSQFKKWPKPTLESFIGLKPNAWFEAKQHQEEASARANDKRRELEAQSNAFEQVQKVLPTDLPRIDTQSFHEELARLGTQAAEAYELQVTTRAKLLSVVSKRQQLRSELKLAGSAQRELDADIAYLSDLPPGSVECPMCGVHHQNSFHARLALSVDADTMGALVQELDGQRDILRNEEAALRGILIEVSQKVDSYEQETRNRKADLQLSDLLATESRRTLDVAFRQAAEPLREELEQLISRESALKDQLKKLDNKARKATVQAFYAGRVSSYSNRLNIPLSEQAQTVKASDRAGAGGSFAARAVLALHLALLDTNVQHGDTPIFPFVMDTPQQSGQDAANLKNMIETAAAAAGKHHQLLFAVETLPDGTDISGFKVVHFQEPQGALRDTDFVLVADFLRLPLRQLDSAFPTQGSKP